MEYLGRTQQVKAALLKRPDLLEKIKSIFVSKIAKDGLHKTIAHGNSREVYEVGTCEVTPKIGISLLLKLNKDQLRMKYSFAAARSQFSDWSEFGAFEMYYDFVAGYLPAVSFRSKAGYERYLSTISLSSRLLPFTFSLAEDWGGTRVGEDDLGALPYFQMVVRYKSWYGQLTEGEPPYIKPRRTANDWLTLDDNTVKNGRIIDLGRTQCSLIEIDRGGSISFNKRYPNNLGVRLRGEKYFRWENRLDIPK